MLSEITSYHPYDTDVVAFACFASNTNRVFQHLNFFLQQSVIQSVDMVVSAYDQINACVKKDTLVLNVNKWTETSEEWQGQVFLIRS